MVKNAPTNSGDSRDAGSIPGSGTSPKRREWQPTSVFLPGKFHGQRSQVGHVHGVAKSRTHPHIILLYEDYIICSISYSWNFRLSAIFIIASILRICSLL